MGKLTRDGHFPVRYFDITRSGSSSKRCLWISGVREQDQIYGRTCRNGEFGSVQLVLLVPEAAKEDRYLKPFLVLQLLMQGRRLSCDGFDSQLN